MVDRVNWSAATARWPGDDVRVGKESFVLAQVDRDFALVNEAFGGLLGWAHSPLRVGSEIARAHGSLAIADVGCGTARAVYEYGSKVAARTGIGLAAVRMAGITKGDYCSHSRNPAVVQAIADGRVGYHLGEAERLWKLGLPPSDVVVMYEVAQYVKSLPMALAEVHKATKPGGHMFFTLPTVATQTHPNAAPTLDKWRVTPGYQVRAVIETIGANGRDHTAEYVHVYRPLEA